VREGFAERYLAMLSAGGTRHHSESLAPLGSMRVTLLSGGSALQMMVGLITGSKPWGSSSTFSI
jgi:hypothetical protein